VGTLGRKLIEGAESVKLFGENVEVNAKIVTLKGISGHADMNGLLDWLSGFTMKPEHVFVVHGEDHVTDEFAQTITEKFGYPAMAPYSGGCVDLATGEILSAGIPAPKKAAEKPADMRKKTTFQRVIAAAKRLLDVVYRNEGLANKELAKFETQIHNLADKWDR
jgi:metallo-beta-lactamase family protein